MEEVDLNNENENEQNDNEQKQNQHENDDQQNKEQDNDDQDNDDQDSDDQENKTKPTISLESNEGNTTKKQNNMTLDGFWEIANNQAKSLVTNVKKLQRFIAEKLYGKHVFDDEVREKVEMMNATLERYQLCHLAVQQLQQSTKALSENVKKMSEFFYSSGLKETAEAYHKQCMTIANTNKELAKEIEIIEKLADKMVQKLNNFLNVALKDTIETALNYDSSRLLYFQYKKDLETLQKRAQNSKSVFKPSESRIEQAKKLVESQKTELDKVSEKFKAKMDFIIQKRSEELEMLLDSYYKPICIFYANCHKLAQSNLEQVLEHNKNVTTNTKEFQSLMSNTN